MAKLLVSSVVVIPVVFLLCFCCGCIERERQALLHFKAGLSYSLVSFYNLSTWEKGGDCCSNRDGITCDVDSHHVVGVDAVTSAEGGVISESLCTLTSLATLHLSGNGLTGTLPHCLGNMSSLTELRLSYNQLTGSIPPSLSNLSSISYIDLSSKQLTGCIPDSLGDISSLDILDLSYNQIN